MSEVKQVKLKFVCSRCGRTLGYYIGEDLMIVGFIDQPAVICKKCYKKEFGGDISMYNMDMEEIFEKTYGRRPTREELETFKEYLQLIRR